MHSSPLTRRRWLALAASCGAAHSAPAQSKPVLLAIDAEFGHVTSTSAQAIERGARIAIDEINQAGGVLDGRPLALELRDNRGVPTRAVQNLRELAALPDVAAVIAGKFSPAVLECMPVAQELGLPLLAAWSAADGITAGQARPNYVFRLSLRDDWALAAMAAHARSTLRARKIAILLPNTAWGRSALDAAERRLAAPGMPRLVNAGWYNWGDKSLADPYRQARGAGAQALLLVANEQEGSILVNEMAQMPAAERLPLVAHWGITGGRFFTMAQPGLSAVKLAVVQTYSFIGDRSAAAQRVLSALQAKYGVKEAADVESPVGVAHAYDLTHLLAKAIRAARSSDRARVRDALERLGPHQGLVRHYREPFTAARHEALDAAQVFLASYDRKGALRRIGQR